MSVWIIALAILLAAAGIALALGDLRKELRRIRESLYDRDDAQ